MEKVTKKICKKCKTPLKRQVIGLNVLQLCRHCGRVTSVQ